ncbi:MAG: SCO family protein [Pikeienuella sp.]
MRLNRLQKALWIAAILALGAFAAAQLVGPRQPAEETAESFRPAFSLPDGAGRLRDNAEFRGRWLLVFFGFSNCPDICPTTLAEVARVMDGLGADAEKVQPLFISIDPERDRLLGIDDFTGAFHPSILGLAGDAAQTSAAAKSFHIFYEREDDEAAPDGYTMSHSQGLFLIGPDGEWLRQYAYGMPAAEILTDLKERI